MAHAVFQGARPGEDTGTFAWDDFFTKEFADTVPAARIESWARRYHPGIESLADLVDLLRGQKNIYDWRRADHFEPEQRARILAYVEQVDGSWADLDRLAGQAAELEDCAARGLDIQAYRERLALPDDLPSEPCLAVLIPEDAPLEVAPPPGPRGGAGA